jgi:hypothetical protein
MFLFKCLNRVLAVSLDTASSPTCWTVEGTPGSTAGTPSGGGSTLLSTTSRFGEIFHRVYPQLHFRTQLNLINETILSRNLCTLGAWTFQVMTRGQILGRNPDKILKSFPQTPATSYSFDSSFTVYCKGERRKPL